MDKYPPLRILVQWREQNVTPEEIHRRCLEYAGDIQPTVLLRMLKFAAMNLI